MAATNEKSNLGIHFFYVALILFALIVLLATQKWTELPRFTDYLSTAATITSLVLGLLAIIYAYISNDSLSQTTGLVTGVANEAQEATTKITQLLTSVELINDGANQSNKHLALIIDELKTQMHSLGETALTLDQQANAIAEVLPEIPKGLDQIGKRIDGLIQTAPGNEKKSSERPISETELNNLAKAAIDQASPAGYLLMYAIHLSHKTGKSFDVKKYSNNFSTSDYMYGFFVALSSLDIIEYDKVGGSKTNVIIKKCPGLFSEAKTAFLAKVDKQKTDATKESWKNAITAVENLFST